MGANLMRGDPHGSQAFPRELCPPSRFRVDSLAGEAIGRREKGLDACLRMCSRLRFLNKMARHTETPWFFHTSNAWYESIVRCMLVFLVSNRTRESVSRNGWDLPKKRCEMPDSRDSIMIMGESSC